MCDRLRDLVCVCWLHTDPGQSDMYGTAVHIRPAAQCAGEGGTKGVCEYSLTQLIINTRPPYTHSLMVRVPTARQEKSGNVNIGQEILELL